MSGHWQPPGKPWTRADAYVVSGGGGGFSRGQVIGGLVVAVVLGVGAGAVLGLREAPRAASAATPAVEQKVETIVPVVVADPADSEWANRSSPVGASDSEAIQPGLPGASGARNDVAGQRIYVIDGDTFVVGSQRVRIANIDAPETHPPRCMEEARLGLAATEKLKSLLGGGAVTLIASGADHDEHGRLLRNVSVNGQDVGEALMSAGVARAYAGGRRSWC